MTRATVKMSTVVGQISQLEIAIKQQGTNGHFTKIDFLELLYQEQLRKVSFFLHISKTPAVSEHDRLPSTSKYMNHNTFN